MEIGRFLVEAHLKEGRPVGELARDYRVSRSWIYKLLARYRRDGPAGLEPRSRRPHHSPTRIADLWEEEIVMLRKELVDAGFDAGAETIQFHLAERHPRVPSVPTIWRVLRARGFVTPQPHKRPKSSFRRFAADFPNECWQTDVTHVRLADGTVVEVLNFIDDHSRLCVASRVFAVVRAADVVRTLHRAAAQWGYPAAVLSDNGAIYAGGPRHGSIAAMEYELLGLGIEIRHGRPYHPQTQGKVERFHQTLKRYLDRQDPPETKRQLQGQLDRFVTYYNERRPHCGVGRRTPQQAYDALGKAAPSGPRLDVVGFRVRRDKVSPSGTVTIRHHSKLHHIGLGRQYAGRRVLVLVAGLDIRVLSLNKELIRHLTLDVTKNYQRQP
jgi:transposase InsO family protein